jgi:hypothetical protein
MARVVLSDLEPNPLPPFVHPRTGEVLETEDDFRRAIDEVERSMIPYWQLRNAIQQGHADRFDGELPARRSQTKKQEVIAHCPRCRRAISEDDAYEVALIRRLRRDRSS